MNWHRIGAPALYSRPRQRMRGEDQATANTEISHTEHKDHEGEYFVFCVIFVAKLSRPVWLSSRSGDGSSA